MKAFLASSVLVFAAALPVIARGEAQIDVSTLKGDAQKGLEIAQETERRDLGYADYLVLGRMILESTGGEKTTRDFKMSTLEVSGDGDKRLVVINEPANLHGLVSLTFTHGLTADDQWIFLPTSNRTKRLSARDKTGTFVGSEFSFEDIATFEVDKYSYEYLRDDDLDGHDCFVVRDTPRYEYSGYSQIVEWVDKEIYQPRKLIYYDRNGRELKVLTFQDYKQFANKYWRPMHQVMANTQNGNTSIIEWTNYEFQTGLTDERLSPQALGTGAE